MMKNLCFRRENLPFPIVWDHLQNLSISLNSTRYDQQIATSHVKKYDE